MAFRTTRLFTGFIGCGLLLAAACAARGDDVAAKAPSRAVPVQLQGSADQGWRLVRGGETYFVRGAGGSQQLKLLAECGGNSIRTWHVVNNGRWIDDLLDEAERQGISVAVGIWLGHERHGFKYNDAEQVAKQFAFVEEAVRRYKDHPAVLLWSLGNEMEGYAKADNAAIWSHINSCAAFVKRLDPHHPTMTVVAEIGGDRVKNVHRLCPEIDILGINSYGGAASVPERYRKLGGTKPYLLTEFGPAGVWESKKNAWGVVPEPTSTQKAESYRRTYEAAVAGSGGLCLGSYAFLWGHKQEATATWFGLLLPDGSRTGPVDALTKLWTGREPKNFCPEITSLELVGASQAAADQSSPDQVEPGATLEAKLVAKDAEGDPLRVEWLLQAETTVLSEGGDAESAPPTFPDAILAASSTSCRVQMPKTPGPYRLFAYVRDDQGGAAYANLPLLAKGVVPPPAAAQTKLPLTVYDEGDSERQPYAASGWMGNHADLKVDPNCTERPHSGKQCLRVDYAAAGEWVGVVWQHPAQDWGDKPGGFDLNGAKRLTFWARGAAGGETVSFEFGLFGKEKKFSDTAKRKLADRKLSTDWQQFEIDLSGLDLSRIKSGFAFVLAGQGKPTTFYLDDVRYE